MCTPPYFFTTPVKACPTADSRPTSATRPWHGKPLAGKFIGDRFYRFVNIQKGHCGALLRHVGADSLADSPGGTGNHGDPSVKTLFITHFHLFFLTRSHRLPGRHRAVRPFKTPGIWKEIP
jgi:hypothetical protein